MEESQKLMQRTFHLCGEVKRLAGIVGSWNVAFRCHCAAADSRLAERCCDQTFFPASHLNPKLRETSDKSFNTFGARNTCPPAQILLSGVYKGKDYSATEFTL